MKPPMPGAIQQLLAASGTKMLRGEPILIMEAIKMEHVIRAPANGTLIALDCAIGDIVEAVCAGCCASAGSRNSGARPFGGQRVLEQSRSDGASGNLKRITLELGGNDPAIVSRLILSGYQHQVSVRFDWNPTDCLGKMLDKTAAWSLRFCQTE